MHDSAGAAGGMAEVVWLGSMNQATALAAAGKWLAGRAERACASVFVANDAGRYSAESFSPAGRRIEFCGHGALAAAFCVFEQHPGADTLAFCNEWRAWEARHSDQAGFNTQLYFARPQVQAFDVPAFAAGCLGRRPNEAAVAGGDSGYLLLEFSTEAEIAQLAPDSAAICAATGRALIATARAGSGIVYRYFAPQYGELEDAATGSAAVQLAAYWQPRLNSERFEARQLSATGARCELACSDDTVELAARVGYG